MQPVSTLGVQKHKHLSFVTPPFSCVEVEGQTVSGNCALPQTQPLRKPREPRQHQAQVAQNIVRPPYTVVLAGSGAPRPSQTAVLELSLALVQDLTKLSRSSGLAQPASAPSSWRPRRRISSSRLPWATKPVSRSFFFFFPVFQDRVSV